MLRLCLGLYRRTCYPRSTAHPHPTAPLPQHHIILPYPHSCFSRRCCITLCASNSAGYCTNHQHVTCLLMASILHSRTRSMAGACRHTCTAGCPVGVAGSRRTALRGGTAARSARRRSELHGTCSQEGCFRSCPSKYQCPGRHSGTQSTRWLGLDTGW